MLLPSGPALIKGFLEPSSNQKDWGQGLPGLSCCCPLLRLHLLLPVLWVPLAFRQSKPMGKKGEKGMTSLLIGQPWNKGRH